jgi:Tfp pilus assembly protein FimT
MKTLKTGTNHQGFGLLEVLIIVLVIAIIGVSALPRVMSSLRNFRMPETQKHIVDALREVRQEAISQKKQITFYYDDRNKNIIISGGSFGDIGDVKNKVISILGDGLSSRNIVYGEPLNAVSTTLSDGAVFTSLTNNKLEIIFQGNGSATDENETLQDQALFFYNPKSPEESAFAISILGVGGRVKIWQYDKKTKSYVE